MARLGGSVSTLCQQGGSRCHVTSHRLKPKVTASPGLSREADRRVESNRRRTGSPRDDEPDSAVCLGEPAETRRSLVPARGPAGRADVTAKATFGGHDVFGGGMLGRRSGVSAETCRPVARPAGVRALMVPMRPRRVGAARGAESKTGPREGERGGGCAMTAPKQDSIGSADAAKRDAEARDWSWVEATVWTERMVSALGNGVKGGFLLRGCRAVRALPGAACRETPPMRKPPTGEP